MDAHPLGRSMRLSITEGALATAMGTLQSGAFLTGFALLLGATPLQVGILAALPTLSSVLQAAGSYWLRGQTQRKRLCVRSFVVSRLLWTPILLVPALTLIGGDAAGVWVVIALIGIGSVFNSIGGVAWLSWIRDLIPDHRRIAFFGRRQQFDTVFALSLSIAGAAFIDWWRQSFPASSGGYLAVFAVGIVSGVIGVLVLNRIPDEQVEKPEDVSLTEAFGAPLGDSQFRRLLTFYAAWNLAVQIAAPFFVVYMLQQLALPLWYVTVLHTLGSVGALVTNRLWVRWSEKYGVQPVIFIATLVDTLFPLAWVFITPSSAWILPLIFLINVCNAPLATGPINLAFRLAPRSKAPTYMGQLNAVIGLVGGLAAILGGYLVGLLESEAQSTVLLSGWAPLKVLFFLSFVGRFASLVLLARIKEPAGAVVEAETSIVAEPATLAFAGATSVGSSADLEVLDNAA